MAVATQTGTPPTAFDIAITPSNSMTAANGMSSPVSFSIVTTGHAKPRLRATFIFVSFDGDDTLPSSSVHSGTSTNKSRGKLTTVALV